MSEENSKVKKSLFAIKKSDDEKIDTIMQNILQMLSQRIVFESGKKYSLLDHSKTKTSTNGDRVFTFEDAFGEKYAVQIILKKITSAGKASVITDFFKNFAEYHKIVVATDYNKKISDFVLARDAQIFYEHSLLM